MIALSRKVAKEAALDTYISKKICEDCRSTGKRWVVSKQCVNCFRLDRTRDGRKRMHKAYLDAFLVTLREGLVFVPMTRDNGLTWTAVGVWKVSEFLNKEPSD